MIGEDEPVPVILPGEEVTVYDVIEEPPVALEVNVTETLLAVTIVAVPIVGACGTDVGVTEFEDDDSGEFPFVPFALTVYVRDVPTVSETVSGLEAPLAVCPLLDVAV